MAYVPYTERGKIKVFFRIRQGIRHVCFSFIKGVWSYSVYASSQHKSWKKPTAFEKIKKSGAARKVQVNTERVLLRQFYFNKERRKYIHV
jgi:hypothetical protein